MRVLIRDDSAILPTVSHFHAQAWNLEKILCYKDWHFFNQSMFMVTLLLTKTFLPLQKLKICMVQMYNTFWFLKIFSSRKITEEKGQFTILIYAIYEQKVQPTEKEHKQTVAF